VCHEKVWLLSYSAVMAAVIEITKSEDDALLSRLVVFNQSNQSINPLLAWSARLAKKLVYRCATTEIKIQNRKLKTSWKCIN